MNAITVATFNEKDQAEVLKNRLENNGIHAIVHDLTKLQRLMFVKDALAAITLEVDRKNYQAARQLLQEWDRSEGVLREAVHCPQCGSPRVEYPQYGRKFVTPAFHLGLGIALGLLPKEFYCEECQYTWKKEDKVDVPRDILGWPKRARH